MSSFSLDGQGGTEITAEEPLEMKRWYTVKVDRDRREGLLLVDGSLVANGSASRALTESLPDMSHLFVGRLPPDVSDYSSLPTRAGYVGCLADLKIEPDHIDLTKGSTILDTANVQPGCEEAPQNTLSFLAGSGGGYVQMPRVTANGSISFSFVFRTGAANGLLFYMVDRTELFYVSLAMVDGALHLYAHPDNEVVTKDLQNRFTKYNDMQWHVVSVIITRTGNNENAIKLHLDDNYVAAPHHVANIPLVAPGSEYDLYFGGLPGGLRPLRAGVAAHEGSFVGCLKDAIVMGNYLNFYEAVTISGASLGECGSGEAAANKKPAESTADGATSGGSSAEEKSPVEAGDPEDGSLDGPEPYDPSIFYTDGALPKPERYGLCQLPISPVMDPDLTAESGMRFGTKSDSFIEYFKKKLPDLMVDKYRFSLEFKTTFENGLIFYMRHNERADFVAVYVKGGKLIYSFDCGSGPSRLGTEFNVADGQWHSVEFSRIDNEGKLMLNGREVKVPDYTRFSVGSTKKLEVEPYLYLGGLDTAMKEDERVKRELQFTTFAAVPGFVGCLRNIKTEGLLRNGRSKMRSLGKWQKNSFVLPCSEKVENGYFFGPEGGRIRAFRKFRVGLDFDITMWIKPRNISGLLLGVKGRRDYVILQVSGER
jgi:laminin alpha 3/5